MKYCKLWCLYALLNMSNGFAWSKNLHGTKHNETDWFGKVVNGIPASISTFPYFALIASFLGVHCGGAVISDRVILTAAHCLQEDHQLLRAQLFSVYLGSSIPLEGEKYEVCKFIPHEMFERDPEDSTWSYDIGLVLLSRRIRFGSKVQKAKLINNRAWGIPGKLLTTIGFGFTKEKGALPERLQMTRMAYVDSKTCANTHFRYKKIPSHIFCMISKYWTGDCYGDSGSPVVWGRFIVGFVSAGLVCASDKFPGLYTEILPFEKWIKSNMKKLESYKCNNDIKKERQYCKIEKVGRTNSNEVQRYTRSGQSVNLEWGRNLKFNLQF